MPVENLEFWNSRFPFQVQPVEFTGQSNICIQQRRGACTTNFRSMPLFMATA